MEQVWMKTPETPSNALSHVVQKNGVGKEQDQGQRQAHSNYHFHV
jgi:hypothetical protein